MAYIHFYAPTYFIPQRYCSHYETAIGQLYANSNMLCAYTYDVHILMQCYAYTRCQPIYTNSMYCPRTHTFTLSATNLIRCVYTKYLVFRYTAAGMSMYKIYAHNIFYVPICVYRRLYYAKLFIHKKYMCTRRYV